MTEEKEVKEFVKDIYGKVASESDVCSCCIDQSEDIDLFAQALFLGYSRGEIKNVPQESLMGLGSGNPLEFVALQKGQTVLDLGSGAGVDSFLAAKKVGDKGHVIGIDMTGEMVRKARILANRYGYQNIDFKEGDVENLPLDDESVDVVISNCVINLTPNKSATFREAYRVLKPGGSMVLSDMVADGELSEYAKWSFEAWTGCQAGLIQKQEYLELMEEAGFLNVAIVKERPFQKLGIGRNSGEEIKSIHVRALRDRFSSS